MKTKTNTNDILPLIGVALMMLWVAGWLIWDLLGDLL